MHNLKLKIICLFCNLERNLTFKFRKDNVFWFIKKFTIYALCQKGFNCLKFRNKTGFQ